MEARKLQTIDDLLLSPEGRVEMIGGTIQRHHVPFYWLIRPEDLVLIAHQPDDGHYRIIATLKDQGRARRRRRRGPRPLPSGGC